MDPIMLNEIKELLTIYGGGIKSTQRGYFEFDWTGDGMTVSVPISTVDPTKVFLDLRVATVKAAERRDMKLGKIVTSANAITIEVGNPGMASYHIQSFVEWQLIEFK